MNSEGGEQRPSVPRVTSLVLSRAAVSACWILGLVLLVGGLVATFVRENGAGAAALIAFGGVLVLLALMKRVPLRFEVAGAKIDATYDDAYDAGREQGTQQALSVALAEIDDAKVEEPSRDADEALERLRSTLASRVWLASTRTLTSAASAEDENAYSVTAAANAAGITHRQREYWARTGLVEPSVRRSDGSSMYTLRDVVLLTVTKRLLDTGVSLQQIRSAVAAIQSGPMEELERVTLMSDGSAVFEMDTPDEVRDLISTGRGVFGISIARVIEQVRTALGDR